MLIKQQVTVEAGGRVAFRSPELREGESVEVTVSAARGAKLSVEERLLLLKQLREHLNLSPEAADEWIAEIRAERAAWDLRVP